MRAQLVAVLFVTFAGVGAPAVASAPAHQPPPVHFPNAVEMSVNDDARAITIVGRMDFYQEGGGAPTDSEVASIVRAVESRWNGHKFKCYEVIVVVDFAIVGSKVQVRDDAVDIRLDSDRIPSSGPMPNSQVLGGDPDKPLSDASADRLRPGHERVETRRPSSWQKYTPDVWAHEFGHVLGLQDSYTNGGRDIVAGAPRDIMFHQALPISAETITKVVRRHNTGQLDESEMKCSLSMAAGPASINMFFTTITDLRVSAHTCEYDAPSADPARVPKPIQWEGEVGYSGSYVGTAGSLLNPISFTSQPGLLYQFSAAPDAVFFAGLYHWGTQGVPVSDGTLTIEGTPTSAIGLPLFPVFSEGAPECP